MITCFDTEFQEDGRTIDFISIGMVRMDGREYYAESSGYDPSRANPWLRENVIPYLGKRGPARTKATIAREVVEFVGPKPQLWAYYSAYDWVALCQLFGTMMDLPEGWPMYCRDLKQELDRLRVGKLQKGTDEHDALADARWVRDVITMLKLDQEAR